MIKRFCDICFNEITVSAASGLTATRRSSIRNEAGSHKITVDVTAVIETGNAVSKDVCKYCVIDTVMSLDDRPRVEAGPA